MKLEAVNAGMSSVWRAPRNKCARLELIDLKVAQQRFVKSGHTCVLIVTHLDRFATYSSRPCGFLNMVNIRESGFVVIEE